MTPASTGFTESSVSQRAQLCDMSPACYGSRALVNALAIATVMLGSDSILILSPWCKSVLAFTCFSMLAISQPGMRRGLQWPFPLALHLAGMNAALRLDSTVARVVIISWLLLTLELTGRRPRSILTPIEATGPGQGNSGLIQMHWAGLAFAGFLLSYGRIDAVWSACVHVCEAVSWKTPMGLWVSGFQVYVMGVVAGWAGLVSDRLKLRALARSAAAVAALGVSFLIGRAILAAATPVDHTDVSVLHLGAVVCVALVMARFSFRRPGPGRICIISSVLTASILLLAFLTNRTADPRRAEGPHRSAVGAGETIGFYSEGLLDWRVPDMERLGLANSGMFGILRRDLDQWASPAGGRVRVTGSISDGFLSDLGVLVFINPSRRPSPSELAAIERFVRKGNGLLVLGDHTNIGNSRVPLNSVLAFTGIRFNFDSAIPHRPGWHGCLETRRHPVNRGVESEAMMQMGVGASLEIERPAVPLVIARYGFSDRGNPENGGRGGFMGNVVHESGERLGGLVLVACQRVGKGRVLVFGDTSPFQNAALFLSRALVRNSVDWLLGDDGKPNGPNPERPSAKEPTATVDFSLKPDANLDLFSDRSLGGLANCLARVNITPLPAFERGQWDREAPFLFLINPTETVRASETEWLFDYMVSGGHVVLAKGHASPQPVDPLLGRLGLKIDPVPLGGGDGTSALSHKEAWAISPACADSIEVRSRAFGFPTTVTRRIGAGTFTLIADGRALLDENLEGEWRGDSLSIHFITNLTEDLRGNTRYAAAQTD